MPTLVNFNALAQLFLHFRFNKCSCYPMCFTFAAWRHFDTDLTIKSPFTDHFLTIGQLVQAVPSAPPAPILPKLGCSPSHFWMPTPEKQLPPSPLKVNQV